MYKRLIDVYLNQGTMLGGNNSIVEIDISTFNNPKETVFVLGLVERSNLKRLRFYILPDRCNETVCSLIKQHVKKDTIIYTDKDRVCEGLDQYFTSHNKVKNLKEIANNKIHTNTIKGNWCGVRLRMSYRYMTNKKIYPYLIRFILKKNKNVHPLKNLLNFIEYY
jgi:transposase-like protein